MLYDHYHTPQNGLSNRFPKPRGLLVTVKLSRHRRRSRHSRRGQHLTSGPRFLNQVLQPASENACTKQFPTQLPQPSPPTLTSCPHLLPSPPALTSYPAPDSRISSQPTPCKRRPNGFPLPGLVWTHVLVCLQFCCSGRPDTNRQAVTHGTDSTARALPANTPTRKDGTS